MDRQGQSSFIYSQEVESEPREGSSLGLRLGRALERAREHLLALQQEDGHWCGELEGDAILESEYILALHYLGRGGEERVRKAARHLRRLQTTSGGWTIFPGGAPEVSCTVKAYFALKLVGDDPGAPHMRRARHTIRELGGLDACNSFTKLYLSVFGQYDWEQAPAVPPEIVLLPRWFPFNIYEMSSWSRAIVVPLSIIWATKPHRAVPEHAAIGELRTGARREAFHPAVGAGRGRIWASFFRAVDRGIKLLERLRLLPLRRLALRRAERWILERLPESDGLGAIFPPIVNTLMALDCLGYDLENPVFRSQVRELEKLEIEEGDTLRVQPCKSPVWDTALALSALAEAVLPPEHAALRAAALWLLEREVRRPGDWRVKAPRAPVGGWYFEYANEFYPDCDDTAQVLTGLAQIDLPPAEREREREVSGRALEWLLAMQNRDGGWSSFDRDCDRTFLTYIPFADHNAMIDPSTVDITSRVLEALSLRGFDSSSPAVRRAVRFVLDEQEPDGSWFGRWGCNYIYGTWLALRGLTAAGEDPAADWGRRAVGWLRRHQNLDGGWGELPTSYDDPAQRGRGPSTAAQTAWALLGLFAARDFESESVRRGVRYLLDSQREDGSWQDAHWTGTGFPKVFYLCYHYYALYFPLWALATYHRRLERSNANE